jgi:hypothetical protein
LTFEDINPPKKAHKNCLMPSNVRKSLKKFTGWSVPCSRDGDISRDPAMCKDKPFFVRTPPRNIDVLRFQPPAPARPLLIASIWKNASTEIRELLKKSPGNLAMGRTCGKLKTGERAPLDEFKCTMNVFNVDLPAHYKAALTRDPLARFVSCSREGFRVGPRRLGGGGGVFHSGG